MPISVKCPCGAKLRAPDHYAAARAECPLCSRIVTIPAQTAKPAEEEIIEAEMVEPKPAQPEPEDAAEATERKPAEKDTDSVYAPDSVETRTFLDPPTGPVAADTKPFLNMSNAGSALCTTCHIK